MRQRCLERLTKEVVPDNRTPDEFRCGSLSDDLPALTARKRAEAGNIYPPLHGQTGSLTAGAAKLFNKALAAPLRNKTRPGAR